MAPRLHARHEKIYLKGMYISLTLYLLSKYSQGMRKLSTDKRVMILSALSEGMSVRATGRMCGVADRTTLRLLVDAGQLARDHHDITVRNLRCDHIEADEAWSFIGGKEKAKKAGANVHGDCWVWTAIDRDTKLIPAYRVGDRGAEDARQFMIDLGSRINGRFALSTDAHHPYLRAVAEAVGTRVDYGTITKVFGQREGEIRYSPPVCLGCRKYEVFGLPNRDEIGTSRIERNNLTLRMESRRFTRLTNGHSKKFINHCHAVAWHFWRYNFARKNIALGGKTPAQAAGLADKPLTIRDFVDMLEEEERRVAGGGRINRADRK